MLESFIVRWGYLAVGIGTFFEGESVLIAGGALAHRGLLALPLVMIAAFIGAVAGDQFWFQVGRRFGRPFIERHERWQARSARVEAWLARSGSSFVLGFRFIYGIRTVTPLLLGASGYPVTRFALLNLLGGAAWATTLGGAGWLLGASLRAILQRSTRLEELFAAVLVVAVALWVGGRWLARRSLHQRGREGDALVDSDT